MEYFRRESVGHKKKPRSYVDAGDCLRIRAVVRVVEPHLFLHARISLHVYQIIINYPYPLYTFLMKRYIFTHNLFARSRFNSAFSQIRLFANKAPKS